jgi:V/A-type H+-transporting ATPase subunit E
MRADEILKLNTEEVDQITRKASGEAKETLEKGEDKARIAAEEEKRKIMSIASLENRKRLLAEKQRIIDRAFQEAIVRLVDGKMDTYKDFLRRQFLEASPDGDEEIYLSGKDMKRLGKSFVDELNSSLESKQKKGNITLAREPVDITGGFILRKGRKEVNCAVEALIDSIRDRIEGEVAGILFPEKEQSKGKTNKKG